MTTKPIKRHPALIELSKDHHFGLLLSWKIRKGAELNVPVERVVKYVIHFFETDLENHFREEEELLFDKMEPGDPMRIRALNEHKLMREQIQQLNEKPVEKTLNEFSALLENHIRFEERQLFNHIQESFSPEELSLTGSELKNRQRPQTSMWNDVFWEELK